MKKNRKLSDFISKRGFYATLLTCVIAVMAIATFATIRNIGPGGNPDNSKVALTDQFNDEFELVPANSTPVKPLSEVINEEKKKESLKEQQSNVTSTPSAIPNPEKTDKKTDGSAKTEESKPNQLENNQKQAESKTDNTQKQSENSENVSQKTPDTENADKTENKTEKSTTTSTGSALSFSAGDSMIWPLEGSIAMDYSMDRTVYDKTLDQYRTNPAICINAAIGSQVKASAAGTVKSIKNEPRTGYTVVIDHGNGWTTTYGQLQETILVKEGQAVEAGTIIGGVATPTKYSILLGGHLSFEVDKDNVPQNPNLLLKK